MFKKILNYWRHQELDGTIDDSIERVTVHQDLFARKKVLRRVYHDFYQSFEPWVKKIPEGHRVELGSGGSFLDEYISRLIKSDIMFINKMNLFLDARYLPFADQSLAALFLINTLHHLPDAELFFSQCQRILKPGGYLFLLEPHYTPWSSLVWSVTGHEAHTTKGPWSFQSAGPLSSSNLALSWMIFSRDAHIFNEKYPDFQIVKRQSHTGLTYLLSGGLSFRAVYPECVYPVIKKVDQTLSYLSQGISDSFETIVLTKKA